MQLGVDRSTVNRKIRNDRGTCLQPLRIETTGTKVGMLPAEHAEHETTQRKKIGADVQRIAAQLFWRYGTGATRTDISTGGAVARDPEISKLCSPVLGNQYIGGLHITVHDALSTGGSQCGGQVRGDRQDAGLGQIGNRQKLFQITTGNVFHHQCQIRRHHYNIVDFHQVRTVEGSNGPGFPDQLFTCHPRAWPGQKFDRNTPTQAVVIAQIDPALSTSANQFDQSIGPYTIALNAGDRESH